MVLRFYKRVDRGCGNRDSRGFYIICAGVPVYCHRLPLDIPKCEHCGQCLIPYKIRGIAKINPAHVFRACGERDITIAPCHRGRCSVCAPPERGWYMAVGKESYSMRSFSAEAELWGISKKVSHIPDDLQTGDILYLGFRDAVWVAETEEWIPQIFCASPITGFEKLVNREKLKDKSYMNELEKRGIDAVIEYDDEGEIRDIYDQGIDMGEPGPDYISDEEMEELRKDIAEAEKDIKEGNVYRVEEMSGEKVFVHEKTGEIERIGGGDVA